MNVHKTHNNSIMNIHQLNDYIESNNLSYFLPSKKNNNIVKFILSNSYSYFNYLPMDIKKIIIDLLQLPPSDFFTSVYNDVFTRNYSSRCYYDSRCNYSFVLNNLLNKIIIRFTHIDKFAILSPKKKHNKIILNDDIIDIGKSNVINFYIDENKIRLLYSYNSCINCIYILSNCCDVVFKYLYQK